MDIQEDKKSKYQSSNQKKQVKIINKMNVEVEVVSQGGTSEKNSNSKKNKKHNHNKQSKEHSKDLMRFERQIFQIKKPEESEQEFVIRKLMMKRDKPQIQQVDRSPLLQRLQFMMPIFKKSQQELATRPITEQDKIDGKLEQLPSQSSSQSQSQEDQTEHKSKKLPPMITEVGFQSMYNNSSKQSEMLEQQLENLNTQDHELIVTEQKTQTRELQINFLTYPYLKQEDLPQFEKNKNSQKKQKQSKIQEQSVSVIKKPKILIQQIGNSQE